MNKESCALKLVGEVILWNFVFHYFSKLSRKFKFIWNLTRITTLYMQTDVHLWTYLAQLFFECKIFRAEYQTHFAINKYFPKIRTVCEITCHVVEPDRPQAAIKHGAWALRAGWIRLQAHNQNMQYLLLLCRNSGYANAPMLIVHCLYCFFF